MVNWFDKGVRNSPCGLPAWLRARVVVFTLVAFLAGALVINAQSFTATLDRHTITLGESATLSLTFQGGTPKEIPALPNIQNLRITYIGQSSQFSFVNGSMTSSVSYNFTLTPTHPGEFEIPALQTTIDGKTVSSKPVKLRVLSPSQTPPEAIESGEQIAFLKLLVPKRQVFVGEIIVAELQFYIRAGTQLAAQPQLTALPTDGLTVGKIAEGRHRQTQFGNTLYVVLPYYVALMVVKSGKLSLGPVTANIIVQQPSPRRQRDPFFDLFGMRDPFDVFNVEQKQVPVAADAEVLEALAVPVQNAPPHFNGAVGNYSLTFSAGPTNVAVGDPITVRVQVAGRGALDLLTLPEQSAWAKFKAFPATSKPAETTDPLGVEGVKTFEQVLVPQSDDITELPPFIFSFFDPDARVFRTLKGPAVQLVVRPAAATPRPTVVAGGGPQDKLPAPDIVPIKQRLGTVATAKPPMLHQPLFWVVQACPVLAWLGLLAWRKRAEALANNPRLRRQREVARVIRNGLAQLDRLAAQNNSDEFFATLHKLLQEQLGERLDLPASAITEAVIEQHLQGRGLPEQTIQTLHELFQLCDQARFAPVKTTQQLIALVPKTRFVLEQLRNWTP